MSETLTQERLKELLSYDAATGEFTWMVRKGSRALPGAAAGSNDGQGYVRIAIDGCRYRAHRLAWLYCYGKWPAAQVDHLNHRRDDNRLSNLREVSHSENQRNASLCRRNTSGELGISLEISRQKWRVLISIDGTGKRKHIGYFSSIEDARSARDEAYERHGYHPNHGAKPPAA
ncbi:TPA: HNH endonuclease [Pseudomonas aeruginosa]|uniref:HNH endonuclease signature motif containing protein n=2 Tax=Pseudomonas aeruginosa TaxID=287 RepID=UPI00193BF0C4|nr:HNH endonuclease [Pseudomonas aeruginosa]HCI1792470.1 HNH endonuclease [Pseudomonas aeruginosa]